MAFSKRYYQLTCIMGALLSLLACKYSSKEPPAGVKSAYIDSLYYKNQTIYLEQIDSNEFLKLDAPCFAWFDPWLLPDYGKRKPEDTTLVCYTDTMVSDSFFGPKPISVKLLTLKTQNGGAVKLVSYFTNNYYYIKQIEQLNSYLVVFADPDDMRFSLFNKVTGKESVLNGYPVISPDGKTICCAPKECNGGDACVSFYIYSFSNGTATLQCEKRDTFIGHPNLKWKDNHTLYMKITNTIETDEGKSFLNKTWYAKLTLPEFTK